MTSLAPLAQQMAISFIAREHFSSRLINTRTALMFISFMLACTGMVFSLYAEYVWLQTFFLPEVAALITAGSAFMLALISAGCSKILDQRRKRTPLFDAAEITESISRIIESVGGELEDPVRDNPKTAIVLASLAGFLAGERRT